MIDKLRGLYDQAMGSLINFWHTRRITIFVSIGIFFLGFIWGVVVA